MWSAKCVIPECNVDSNLFNVLLQFGKDGVNHTKGNTTVIKKVQEKFDDLFCVAIIDRDRRDIDFIKDECKKIEIGNTDDYFLLFKRKNKYHFFIQIVPAIEEWIMKVATDLGIDLFETDLKISSLEELKILSKKLVSKNDVRFKSLFKEFLKRAEESKHVPILKLRNIIRYLLEKNFQVDINELKNV
jgi:activator of 2-hydroxyglutaryl-CoA dehydratase